MCIYIAMRLFCIGLLLCSTVGSEAQIYPTAQATHTVWEFNLDASEFGMSTDDFFDWRCYRHIDDSVRLTGLTSFLFETPEHGLLGRMGFGTVRNEPLSAIMRGIGMLKIYTDLELIRAMKGAQKGNLNTTNYEMQVKTPGQARIRLASNRDNLNEQVNTLLLVLPRDREIWNSLTKIAEMFDMQPLQLAKLVAEFGAEAQSDWFWFILARHVDLH